MKGTEKKTHLTQHTGALTRQGFLKALPLFQKSQGKTRDLSPYVEAEICRQQKRMAREGRQLPIRLCLFVNQVKAGQVLLCPCCGAPLAGNGRSFKFITREIALGHGPAALLIECILCPQKTCGACRHAGAPYCYKVVPDTAAFHQKWASEEYEKGLLGDASGDCLLADSTLARLAKALARQVLKLLACPGEALAAAETAVAAAVGFEAVSEAFAAFITLLFGENLPRKWYARLTHRVRLGRRVTQFSRLK